MSDNDLIRRGDALYAIAGWEIPSTAIAALPAVTVGVRPLVWQFEQEDVQVANTSARHQYRIVFDRRATVGAWMWFCDGRWICCETEDAAKAAAQADFDARTLAALDLTPAPDAQAIREAALREAHDAIADYPRTSPDGTEAQHYDEQIEHSQAIILALIPKGGA